MSKWSFKANSYDKDIFLKAPIGCELSISVDYDDVDHEVVNFQLKKLVEILNRVNIKEWKYKPPCLNCDLFCSFDGEEVKRGSNCDNIGKKGCKL
jgi:hypothetical protein